VIQSGNGILGIAIAALGGAAIGVDRQRAYRENEPGAIGGLRTFTLLGTVAGACGFLIANALITLGVVILASTAAMVLIVRLGAGRIPRDATTELAAMVVIASGVTAGLGHLGIAAALYAWTLLLLIEKSWLYALVNRIGLIELEAAAQFAAMALIVLPLLPSGNLGPRGILNLRSLWTLVLVFSALSFVGYLARKTMGAKIGWVFTGLIGGLVSSTQVALSFSRDSRSHPEAYGPLSGGVIAATSVSMLRVCILCLLLRPALAIATFVYVIAPLSIGVLFTVYSLRRPSSERASLEEKNPLHVLTAAYLALIFIAAQYVVTFARAWLGNAGMFGSAGLVGSIDIDALVASLAPMVRQGMETSSVARVIAVGILGNTAMKFAIALIWGKNAFRKSTALGFACIFSGLALSLVFIHQ
jgi:uncharacterized membrane protein (DUF4010 family)